MLLDPERYHGTLLVASLTHHRDFNSDSPVTAGRILVGPVTEAFNSDSIVTAGRIRAVPLIPPTVGWPSQLPDIQWDFTIAPGIAYLANGITPIECSIS